VSVLTLSLIYLGLCIVALVYCAFSDKGLDAVDIVVVPLIFFVGFCMALAGIWA
jgi:hypothetical protein